MARIKKIFAYKILPLVIGASALMGCKRTTESNVISAYYEDCYVIDETDYVIFEYNDTYLCLVLDSAGNGIPYDTIKLPPALLSERWPTQRQKVEDALYQGCEITVKRKGDHIKRINVWTR